MTDTKTKPHGWVPSAYKEEFIPYGISCLQAYRDNRCDLPVCLVSPKLLDWVEKAKNELMVQSSSWARDLTIELEAIEKEFKS